MIALVLLYVGAVLFLNGIWLLGHIQDREIAIINVLAGGIALIGAVVSIVVGTMNDDFGAIVLAAQVLLFSFTYLWVAYNRYVEVDGRGLGWYCLFVAITALPTGLATLGQTGGHPWLIWLGLNWLAWAALWLMYWVLLGLQKPIARTAGYVTVLQGILTAWLPGYLLMMGYLSLPA